MDRLTAMQVFVEVAHRGSFTATSEELNLSRAMVTRYISELENWLGVRLLQRSTRKVTLTDAGNHFLVKCHKIIEITNETQEEINQQDSQLRGSLRLSASLSFGVTQLAPVISDFLALYPKLRIDLQLSDKALNLIEERIDLAIRITNNPGLGLVGRKLAICETLIVASPSYLKQHGTPVTPEQLAGHECLSFSHFGRSEWLLQRGDEHHTIKVSGRLSANESTALLQVARHGVGVTLQPCYMVEALIQRGELVEVLPDWKVSSLGIYALYPSRRQLPRALRALLDFLQQHFSDPSWCHKMPF